MWRASFARGRLSTWSPLWQLLGQMGRSREAEDVLWQAADCGDVHAQRLLLAMLRRARRGGEIEQALRGMAANGNPQAERELAILLHNGLAVGIQPGVSTQMSWIPGRLGRSASSSSES